MSSLPPVAENIKHEICVAFKKCGLIITDDQLSKVKFANGVVNFEDAFKDTDLTLTNDQLKIIIAHLSEHTITFKSNVTEFKRDATGAFVSYDRGHYDDISKVMMADNKLQPDDIKNAFNNHKATGDIRYSQSVADDSAMLIDPIDVISESMNIESLLKAPCT